MEGLEGKFPHRCCILSKSCEKVFLLNPYLIFNVCTVQAHVEDIKKTHLRDLMSDADRCKSMIAYVPLFFFFLDFWKLHLFILYSLAF